MSAEPEAFWRVADVARFLSMSKQWVYKHAELGTLPASRFGAGLRFKPDEIRAYADAQSSGAKKSSNLLSFPPAR